MLAKLPLVRLNAGTFDEERAIELVLEQAELFASKESSSLAYFGVKLQAPEDSTAQ